MGRQQRMLRVYGFANAREDVVRARLSGRRMQRVIDSLSHAGEHVAGHLAIVDGGEPSRTVFVVQDAHVPGVRVAIADHDVRQRPAQQELRVDPR